MLNFIEEIEKINYEYVVFRKIWLCIDFHAILLLFDKSPITIKYELL
jgi:hypothetical protein